MATSSARWVSAGRPGPARPQASSSRTARVVMPAVGPEIAQQPPQQRRRRSPSWLGELRPDPCRDAIRPARPALSSSIPLRPRRTQRGEHQEAERDGEIAEDQPPDQDVERGELPRHVDDITAADSTSRDAGGAGSRGEVEQEDDQGLHQQDVDEIGVDAHRAQRHVARPAACWRAKARRGWWPRAAPASPAGVLNATTLRGPGRSLRAASRAGPPPAGSAGRWPQRDRWSRSRTSAWGRRSRR